MNNNVNIPFLRTENTKNLKADCDKCFGLCCVALCFSASDGFPVDKADGQPCLNLLEDFHCRVHNDLSKMGLKGCLSYECFGAGQKISQNTFNRISWLQSKELSLKMFDCFLIMRQLHELLWYLTQAIEQKASSSIKDELISAFDETKIIANGGQEAIMILDIASQRQKVNLLLLQTSEFVRREVIEQSKTLPANYNINSNVNEKISKKKIGPYKDLIGADLRNTDLRGANLRGTYLIASDLRGCNLQGADLIGADLRDADIRGADFSESIFFTQAQLNSAKGNSNTKVGYLLAIPAHWEIC